MIKYLYAMRNRYGSFYENPLCDICPPDKYFEVVTQSLVYADVNLLSRYKENELVCLGSLDNKTGEIKSEVTVLGDLGPVCETLVSRILEKQNVGKEVSKEA